VKWWWLEWFGYDLGSRELIVDFVIWPIWLDDYSSLGWHAFLAGSWVVAQLSSDGHNHTK